MKVVSRQHLLHKTLAIYVLYSSGAEYVYNIGYHKWNLCLWLTMHLGIHEDFPYFLLPSHTKVSTVGMYG